MDNHVLITDYLWFQEGPGVRNTQYTTDGVKLLNVANFVDGNIDLTTSSRYISDEEAYGKYKHFLVDEGDFLIASSGIQVDYFEKKMGFIRPEQLPLCMNTSTIRFKNLKPDELDMRYFMYYLKSNAFKNQLAKYIVGSAQLNFGPSHLKKMTFPVVEIKRQKYIVENLEKIYTLIALRKQQLAKLDELVKARFVELFGDPEKNTFSWKEEELSEHLTVIGGYAFKSEQFSEEGIPVLRIGNINSGFFKPVNLVYWEDDDTLSRYKMYPGDLVMSLTGTVGKDDYGNVCILGNDYDVYYLNQRNAKLELQDTMNKYYLSMLLKFEPIKKKLTGISRGVRQANISNKDILNLSVPIPPIELQNQFATFVEQTDKSKLEIQKSLEKLELLKKALMQKYFG